MANSADPAPELVYVPGPCPTCGARTLAEARTMCRPDEDETGEHSCAGDMDDATGNILVPTPESVAALDAWYDRKGREESR